jgi:hypothetical protein
MLRKCSIGMQTVTLRHREVSAVEPATPTSSARPDYQAGSLEVLPAARRLHGHDDDALSPRQPAYRAVHLFVTVSIGRNV